jgi:hypothetical protein
MKGYRQCLMKTKGRNAIPAHSVTVHGVGRQDFKMKYQGTTYPILIFGHINMKR